jgi:hypothetical protein
MTSVLENMLGGAKRQDYEDFVKRYEQGPPAHGISDDEAVKRHDELAAHLPRDQYEDCARQALARLSPDERRQLGRHMQAQARNRKLNLPSRGEQTFEDTGGLAQLLGGLQQQQPGLVGQLLGGGGGSGMPASPIARAALGGIAAMAAKRVMGR